MPFRCFDGTGENILTNTKCWILKAEMLLNLKGWLVRDFLWTRKSSQTVCEARLRFDFPGMIPYAWLKRSSRGGQQSRHWMFRGLFRLLWGRWFASCITMAKPSLSDQQHDPRSLYLILIHSSNQVFPILRASTSWGGLPPRAPALIGFGATAEEACVLRDADPVNPKAPPFCSLHFNFSQAHCDLLFHMNFNIFLMTGVLAAHSIFCC